MMLPDITGLPEKIGVVGTMIFVVFFLLYQHIRAEGGKTMTPDSLSKRLAGIEDDIEKLEGRCATTERKMDRVLDRGRDYDTWKERWILMWDRHRERTGYREDEREFDRS